MRARNILNMLKNNLQHAKNFTQENKETILTTAKVATGGGLIAVALDTSTDNQVKGEKAFAGAALATLLALRNNIHPTHLKSGLALLATAFVGGGALYDKRHEWHSKSHLECYDTFMDKYHQKLENLQLLEENRARKTGKLFSDILNSATKNLPVEDSKKDDSVMRNLNSRP